MPEEDAPPWTVVVASPCCGWLPVASSPFSGPPLPAANLNCSSASSGSVFSTSAVPLGDHGVPFSAFSSPWSCCSSGGSLLMVLTVITSPVEVLTRISLLRVLLPSQSPPPQLMSVLALGCDTLYMTVSANWHSGELYSFSHLLQ